MKDGIRSQRVGKDHAEAAHVDEELRARAVVSDAVVLLRTTETALAIMTWQDVVQSVSITKAVMDDLESWHHHAKPCGTASLAKGCHSTGDVVAVHKSQSCASALKDMLTHVLWALQFTCCVASKKRSQKNQEASSVVQNIHMPTGRMHIDTHRV